MHVDGCILVSIRGMSRILAPNSVDSIFIDSLFKDTFADNIFLVELFFSVGLAVDDLIWF